MKTSLILLILTNQFPCIEAVKGYPLKVVDYFPKSAPQFAELAAWEDGQWISSSLFKGLAKFDDRRWKKVGCPDE